MSTQAGDFNFGGGCAASDCLRIVLLSSSQFCTEHTLSTPVEPSVLGASNEPERECFARSGSRRPHLLSTRCSLANSESTRHANATTRNHSTSKSDSMAKPQSSKAQSSSQHVKSTDSTDSFKNSPKNPTPLQDTIPAVVPDVTPSSHSLGSGQGQIASKINNESLNRSREPDQPPKMPLGILSGLDKDEMQQIMSKTAQSKPAPVAPMGPEDCLRHASKVKVNDNTTTQVSSRIKLTLPASVTVEKPNQDVEMNKISRPPEPRPSSTATGDIGKSPTKAHNKELPMRKWQPDPCSKTNKRDYDKMNKNVTRDTEASSVPDEPRPKEFRAHKRQRPNDTPASIASAAGELPDDDDDDESNAADISGVESEVESCSIHANNPTAVAKARAYRERLLAQFDSTAFDSLIYQQSDLQPPSGVIVSKHVRHKTATSSKDRIFLPVNPVIHTLHNRSQEWHAKKSQEIEQRPTRKAWVGKVRERQEWFRAREAEQERVYQRAVKDGKTSPYREPKPRGHKQAIDFGDVPEADLPEDVRSNPAWLKACAWFRRSNNIAARRQLEINRSAQEAQRFFMEQFQAPSL